MGASEGLSRLESHDGGECRVIKIRASWWSKRRVSKTKVTFLGRVYSNHDKSLVVEERVELTVVGHSGNTTTCITYHRVPNHSGNHYGKSKEKAMHEGKKGEREEEEAVDEREEDEDGEEEWWRRRRTSMWQWWWWWRKKGRVVDGGGDGYGGDGSGGERREQLLAVVVMVMVVVEEEGKSC
ncbi:hypothetical protein PoB_006128300 [Plakobranchus ocellatus]|uniref:Uncharacterized protein n=1 Tax=Plakobranchus ocellatus TaxID=259542 RepID=A0AAV4CSC2_9GAST|nr:hypothetical protein PoB_006128300 [Plakobranchus ocellatus]